MTVTLIDNIKIPWLAGKKKPPLIPEDLKELQRGFKIAPDFVSMDYMWFEVEEIENGYTYHGFRVVRLLELRFIPLDARADSGLLQKMKSVLRSLYGAKVSFVCLTGGLFSCPAVGIVQCYGVSVFSETLEEAVFKSKQALYALKSAMVSAYRQMKLEPLSTETGRWIFTSLAGMNHTLVVVGQPDPRENTKGGSTALVSNPLTSGNDTSQQYSLQQNEILFRGMSSLKEDFVFMVMTSPISLSNIADMLVGLGEQTSSWASWQTGMRAASFGVSLPAILAGSMTDGTAHGTGTNTGISHSDGTAHTDGTAHSDGTAHTVGHADSSTWGKTETNGVTVTDSTSHSEGVTNSTGTSHSEGQSTSESTGTNSGTNYGNTVGGSVSAGVPGVVSASGSYDHNWGGSNGVSSGESSGTSSSDTTSQSTAISSSNSTGHSVAVSHSESNSIGGGSTDSTADTTSQSDATNHSDATSKSDGTNSGSSISDSSSQGFSNGLSVGIAPSMSISESYQWQYDPAILLVEILRTQQRLLKNASIEGAYYCDVYAFAKTEEGKKAMMGLIPEAFYGTEDVVTGVQTRDMTPDEEQYIIRHAQVFSPSTRIQTIPEVMSGYMDSSMLTLLQLAAYTAPGVYELGTATTVQEATPDFAFYPEMKGDVEIGRLWAGELGEYTNALMRLSPERHFHTVFCGDTGFGKSVAAERLAFETTLKWHYRTVVLDFGQGWRRALNWSGLEGRVDVRQIFPGAQRPLRWNILQVPKRMNAGQYRSMIAELFANAGQMGPRQLGFLRRAITENYQNNGVLLVDPGATSQHERELLFWSKIQNEQEVSAVMARRNELGIDPRDKDSYPPVSVDMPLSAMAASDQQAVFVCRSKNCNIRQVITSLRSMQNSIGKNDQASRTSLEGLLLRVEIFEDADMFRQYGPGADSLPIEDLGLLGDKDDPWGLVVIEGGSEMSDEFSKIAILSLLASILYFDAIARRRESLAGAKFPPMQIFFEEANKILSGTGAGAATSDGTGSKEGGVGEIFQTMWRDGRKYKIFLHLMAQTVSQLPEGIMASCNNIFCVQTKNAKDRDMVLAHIGRSEKGIVNTEYKRYLARIPLKTALCKLGYSDDVTQIEPMLVNPTRVPGEEPSDRDIISILGRN
jgi:hypothetical protein